MSEHPIGLRALEPGDFPLLARWLAEPHVRRWWNHEFTAAAIERDFGPVARGQEPGEDLLAVHGSRPFALVQRSLLGDHPEYSSEIARHTPVPPAAITLDYLIGDPWLVGRGLGTALVSAALRSTWRAHPATTAIIVPVVAANVASWRTLHRAGMERIAEGEMTPDNPLDDPLHVIYRIDRMTDRR